MSTLEDIDPGRPLMLRAYRHDLDRAAMAPVQSLPVIELLGADVSVFLRWAAIPGWRPFFEEDLQCLSQDLQGYALLSTQLPLVTIREQFCFGGRQMQDAAAQALMDRLRTLMRGWRDAGADMVDICGYCRRDARHAHQQSAHA